MISSGSANRILFHDKEPYVFAAITSLIMPVWFSKNGRYAIIYISKVFNGVTE